MSLKLSTLASFCIPWTIAPDQRDAAGWNSLPSPQSEVLCATEGTMTQCLYSGCLVVKMGIMLFNSGTTAKLGILIKSCPVLAALGSEFK